MRADNEEMNLRQNKAYIPTVFFFYCLMIIVILILRDVMGISISKWLILLVCIIPYVIFDLSYSMAFTIFLLPLAKGLPFNYICLFSLAIIITKYINRIALNKYIFVTFLILILEMLSVFYGRFSLADYIRFIGPFLLLSLLVFQSNDNDIDYRTIILYFLLGTIGGELSVIWQTINTFGTNVLLSIGTRLGETNTVPNFQDIRLSYNPNGLGRICAYGISAILVLMHKSKLPKTLLMILLVSQVVIGTMTLSRYFILLMVIILAIYIASTTDSAKQLIKGILVLCVALVGVYYSASYFAPNVVEGYLARGLTQQDLSNGRIEIGSAYLDSIVQNPERLFLGVGLQNYMEKVGMYVSCHSGPEEVLITWGIIGELLVVLFIWGLYKHGWRDVPNYRRKFIYLIPLIVFLVSIQSGQFFSTNEELWLILPYAVMRLAKDHANQEFFYEVSEQNGLCEI